ncbi:MAG: radical SAM protein [Spirochaetaceae bacterium]|jgi:putative pyruvate formate lyase activating enzyme|nr:radical SAM protein [Spirochaetaceae bacterium]
MLETLYADCQLCPRRCHARRNVGERGFCGASADLKLALASLHYGEEPPITGKGGSGTVFATHCSLGCVFCQNHEISHSGMGRTVSTAEFAGILHLLESAGAENINLVTGTHAIPALITGIVQARAEGIKLPLLWNSSGYETLEALDILHEHVDSYLPDLKTLDSDIARQFFNAEDYPHHAVTAIKRMMQQKPGNVLIRHLVIPGHLNSTRNVLLWFVNNAAKHAQLSLMTQYTPVQTPRSSGILYPRRCLNTEEYDTVLRWLEEFGIDDGYYQELNTDSSWLPSFSRPNPFSSALSKTLWTWKTE